MGKTRALAEVVRIAAPRVRVIPAGAWPLGGPAAGRTSSARDPLQPLFDALPPDHPIAQRRGQLSPGGDGGARDRVARELLQAIDDLAAQQPLALVFDDLQWADEVTLALLQAIPDRWLETRPILWICSLRSDAPDAVRACTRRSDAESIAIDALPLAATSEMLCDVLALDSIDADLAVRVHDAARGNPLYAMELVRLGLAEGWLRRLAPGRLLARAAPLPIPTSTSELLARRLRGIEGAQRALLEAGAVLGRSFDEADACEVAGVAPEQGFEALASSRRARRSSPTPRRRSCASRAIRSPSRCTRRSRTSAARSCTVVPRTRWSRARPQTAEPDRAATRPSHTTGPWLAKRRASSAREPRPRRKHSPALHSRRRARTSIARSSSTRSCSALHPAAIRSSALAGTWSGRVAPTRWPIRRLSSARRAPRWRRSASAFPTRSATGARLRCGGWRRGCCRAARSPIRHPPSANGSSRARPTCWSTISYRDELPAMIGSALVATRAAERSGEITAAARSWMVLASIYGLVRLHDAAERNFARGQKAAVEGHDRSEQAYCLATRAVYHADFGDFAGAGEAVAAAERCLEGVDDPFQREIVVTMRGHVAHFTGRYERARAAYEEVLASARARRNVQREAWGLFSLARSELVQGRNELAREKLEAARALLRSSPELQSEIICLGLLALARWRCGDEPGALAAAAEARACIERSSPSGFPGVVAYSALAEIWTLALASRDDARLRDALRRHMRAFRRFVYLFPMASPAFEYARRRSSRAARQGRGGATATAPIDRASAGVRHAARRGARAACAGATRLRRAATAQLRNGSGRDPGANRRASRGAGNAMSEGRKRLAVLGGGMSSLVAVHALTSRPRWQERSTSPCIRWVGDSAARARAGATTRRVSASKSTACTCSSAATRTPSGSSTPCTARCHTLPASAAGSSTTRSSRMTAC